ncbi:hypothetical protein [Mycolicibacterium sp. J2]|jgi:hypothetical protein|uniref:hypothetical protein n=1 Tax=Mycolicibacterium sp. J2 TaxID=2993511 RepID=UPI00224B5CB7|nr:hypothetical protein [Mycolicibacterium sp. J2]MCX2714531.1 hypothetical protein [Mycolicibacterium sp. J2]
MPRHRKPSAPYLRGGIAGAAIIGSGYLLAATNAAVAQADPACFPGAPACVGGSGGTAAVAVVAGPLLIGNGTARHPDGGLLFGNGYSPDPATCGT